MSDIDKLAKIIWTTSRQYEGSISATGANIIAAAILSAGYAPPKYAVGQTVQGDDYFNLPLWSIVGGDIVKVSRDTWYDKTYDARYPCDSLSLARELTYLGEEDE